MGSFLSIITYGTKTWTKSHVTFDSFSFFSFLLSFSLCPRYSEIMLDKVHADGGVKIGYRIDRKLRFFALNHHQKESKYLSKNSSVALFTQIKMICSFMFEAILYYSTSQRK